MPNHLIRLEDAKAAMTSGPGNWISRRQAIDALAALPAVEEGEQLAAAVRRHWLALMGLSSEEIDEEIRRDHPTDVNAELAELVAMGRVRRRSASAPAPAEREKGTQHVATLAKYPLLRQAALDIAYDNGYVNRTSTEAEWMAGAESVVREETEKALSESEAVLAGLTREERRQIACGDCDAADSLLEKTCDDIRANTLIAILNGFFEVDV